MPDTIGTIDVPEVPPSGTFPLRLEYPYAMALDPLVITHRFPSANAKTEQRFLVDSGARRWRAVWRLSEADHDDLVEFWEARQGPYEPFTLSVVNAAGNDTEDVIVRFVDAPLTVDSLAVQIQTGIEFIEQPTEFPVYTVEATDDRFPDAALNTALTGQVNQLIKLVKIQPLQAGYPAIYLADQRCTVGGQLYLARLVDIPTGISQRLGYDADQTTMVFGNADGVMSALAAAVNLQWAEVQFSAYHVQSQVLWNGWKGKVINSGSDKAAGTFELQCSDPMYELALLYPPDDLAEDCRNTFDDGAACPWSTASGVGDGTACDHSLEGSNGCRAHEMIEYFGGVLLTPQSIRIRDEKRQWVTQISRVADSAAGLPLPEHYGLKPRPVKCVLVEGREENTFYNGLGVLGMGPLDLAVGTFDRAGNPRLVRLDGQPQHGYPSNVGLRFVRGTIPAGPTEFFSLGQSGDQTNGDPKKIYSGNSTYNLQYAARVSFVDLRRVDEKGIQLSTIDTHEMEAPIDGGTEVWVWTAAGVRSKVKTDNPIWIALFVYLRRKKLEFVSAATAETYFDLDAALFCAPICELVVPKVIGVGTERQFTFDGSITERKALRDWLVAILNTSLCDFIFTNGRLKFIIREDAAAAHSFTNGNIVLDSLQVAAKRPAFNNLSVVYADADYEMVAAPPLPVVAEDHIAYLGYPLDGQLPLTGAATRSLAARLGEVRLKEELGGATLAEWLVARDVSWRSTALALGVEVGQGVSIEDDDIPGGAGLFRVVAWRLNVNDWSIDFSGTTITDSMYDGISGPKAADVPSNNVPAERFPLPLRSAWFPHGIAPRSDDAVFEETDETFDLVQTYDDSGDGSKIATLSILGRLPVNGFKGDTESPIIRTVSPVGAGGSLQGNQSYWAAVCARDVDGNYSPPSPIRRFHLAAGATWQVTFTDIDWPAGTWEDGVLFVGDSENTICSQIETLGSLPSSFVFTGPLKQSTIGLPNTNNKLVCVRRKASLHSGVLRFAIDDVNTAGDVVVNALAGLGDNWVGRILTLLCDLSDGSTPPLNFEVTAYNDALGAFTLTPDPVTVGLEAGDVMVIRCTPSTFTDFTIGDAGFINGASGGLIVDGEIGAIVRGITPGKPHQLRRVVSNTSTVYTVESAWDSEPLYFIVEDPNWSTPIESSAMDVFTSDVDVTLQMPLPNLLDVVLVIGGFIRDTRAQETPEELVVIREVWISGAIGTGITEPPAGDPGEEYADLVTGFTADVDYGVNEAGNQTFAFRGSWTEPVDERYRGGVVYARPVGGTSAEDRILATVGVGDPNFATDFWPVPFDPIDWDLFVTSYDRTGRRNSIQIGLTPQDTVTVERQVGGAGQENAPFVSSFTAAVAYGVNEAGDQTYSISGSWTLPVDLSKFRGVVIIHRLGGIDRVLAIENDGSVAFKTDSWPVPFTPESPTVYAVSTDGNGRRNSITGSTPAQALGPIERQAGGSGQEYAPFVTGVSAVVNYTVSEGANWRFSFSGGWTLPVDLSKFRGVKVVARPTSGPDKNLATETEGSVLFNTDDWPVGWTTEAFDIYFVSIDANNRANSITGSTPKVSVSVARPTSPAGTEAAALVTGFTAAVSYETTEAGDQMYRISGSWTLPSNLSRFRGVVIVHRLGGVDRVLATENDGSTSFKTDAWPVPSVLESPTVYAVSADGTNRRNSITGATPSQALTVQPQSGPSGQERAPNVTGFSASIHFGVDEAGDQTYWLDGSWTNPVSASFKGVYLIGVLASDPTHGFIYAKEYDGATNFRTQEYPIQTGSDTLYLFCVSSDASGRLNGVDISTPGTTFTLTRQAGSTGQEFAPFVTSFSGSLVTKATESGVQQFGFEGSWALPSNVTKFRGVKLVMRISGVPDSILATETNGSTSFKTDFWDTYDSATAFTIYAVSIDANNRANSITGSTPNISGTITKGASGTLKLATRADSAQVGAGLSTAGSTLGIPSNGIAGSMVQAAAIGNAHIADCSISKLTAGAASFTGSVTFTSTSTVEFNSATGFKVLTGGVYLNTSVQVGSFISMGSTPGAGNTYINDGGSGRCSFVTFEHTATAGETCSNGFMFYRNGTQIRVRFADGTDKEVTLI